MDSGRNLSRTRVVLGLVAVVAGTAWAVGGAGEPARVGRIGLIVLPILLVMTAVVRVLRVAMPSGTMAGPVVLLMLAAVSALVAAAVLGKLHAGDLTKIGAIAVVGGGVTMALSRRSGTEPDIGVRHLTAVFGTAGRPIIGSSPAKFVTRAVFGTVGVDLSAAEFPDFTERVTIDITVLFGRVEITVPRDWQVGVGRVELARRIDFKGQLDSTEPIGEDNPDDWVVVNVQGLGGAVRLHRR
jgi:hypothetical protein